MAEPPRTLVLGRAPPEDVEPDGEVTVGVLHDAERGERTDGEPGLLAQLAPGRDLRRFPPM